MGLNLFQIVSLIIIFMIMFYIWSIYRVHLISIFFIGGIILILLSKLDFLDFKGKLDVLSVVFITLSYIFINIFSCILYFFDSFKRKIYYFLFPIIAFLIVAIVLVCLIDSYKYLEYKFGILLRLFLAFFPLYFYMYYLKYIKKTRKE